MVTIYVPTSATTNAYTKVSKDRTRLFNVKEGVNWFVQFGEDLPHQIKPGTWFLVDANENYSLIPGETTLKMEIYTY